MAVRTITTPQLLGVWAIILSLGLGFFSTAAWACAPLPCDSGYLLPMGDAQVPVNAPGAVWLGGQGGQQPPAKDGSYGVSLTRLSPSKGDVPAVVSGGVQGRGRLIQPKGGWKVGERYTLSAPSTCSYGSFRKARFEAEITVGPEVPLPTQLGSIEVAPNTHAILKIGTALGSCSTQANTVYADVGLVLAEAARPWEALFEYETLVDGKRVVFSEEIGVGPLPWTSWVGRGRDRVYALCGDSPGFEGVGTGVHTVQFRATVAGTTRSVLSEEAQVELRCPNEPSPSEGATVEPAEGKTGAVAGCGCASSPTVGLLGWVGMVPWLWLAARRRLAGAVSLDSQSGAVTLVDPSAPEEDST